MANGPLGGFMPTPAAPAQSPQVKLDTTADSRGNFNNFLKNMNGATLVDPPVVAPVMGAMTPNMAPALSNIDIFNQPVQMMFDGGFVDDTVGDTSGTFSVDEDTGETSDDFDYYSGSDDPPPSTDLSSDIIQAGTLDTPLNVFADDAQASVGTNVGLEKSGGFSAGVQKDVPGRFTSFRSPSFAMRGIARDFRSKIQGAGDDGLTVANYFNTYNPEGTNEPRLKEFEELTGKKAGDKLNIGDMQNIMNIQAKYEAGIRNVAPSVQKAILNTVDIDDDKKVEDILGNLDLGKSLLADPIDFQEIVANPRIGSPAMAGLPAVTSRFNVTKPKSEIEVLRDAVANTIRQTKTPLSDTEKALQQNQLAQQGLNLGPVTFDDDLANFGQNVRDTSQLYSPPEATKEQRVQELLDRGQLAERDKMVQEMDAIDRERDPLDPTNITRTALGGRGQGATTTTTTLPEDYEERVGLPFSDKRMRDIERLYNVPEGQRRIGEGDNPNTLRGIPTALNFLETVPREQMAIDIALGRPRGLGEMIRGFTAPSMFVDNQGRALVSDSKGNLVPSSTVKPETFTQFTNRLQRNIADESGETRDFTSREIPESQLIRNNRGRVIGIRDSSGRLVTGMDPDAPIGGDDSGPDPIIRPLTPKKPEVDPKPDLPPNVIGGTALAEIPQLPTVVESPFGKSTAEFTPVTFDAGDLNKLIEQLVGVSARPVVSAKEGGVIGMANGGLIKAVDDFLAAG